MRVLVLRVTPRAVVMRRPGVQTPNTAHLCCRLSSKRLGEALHRVVVRPHITMQLQQLVHGQTCFSRQAWQRTSVRAAPCRSHISASTRRCHRLKAASDTPSEFDVDNKAVTKIDAELGPREDDVLPDSLADAVAKAAAATSMAINSGNARCQVEIHLPEFWDPISGPIFPNKGDQERFWRMTRRFVEALAEETGASSVKAIYPDAGVAAMLAYQWQDATFSLNSLNSRSPVAPEDELVVVCCPDPPGAEECRKLVSMVGDQDEKAGVMDRPVVMFNQRLSSGDVGIGLNARRLRENFLKRFVTTYSLRPVGEIGTVFKRYPEQWKVFIEDAELPGRYRLIATQAVRPAGEALDYLIEQALNPDAVQGSDAADGGASGSRSLLSTVGSTINSMQRFMRSLSQ